MDFELQNKNGNVLHTGAHPMPANSGLPHAITWEGKTFKSIPVHTGKAYVYVEVAAYTGKGKVVAL